MNNRSELLILIIIDLIAVVTLMVSLLSKAYLPYLFIFPVLVISLITIVFLFKYENTNIIYWHIFILYILRSSVYFLSTEFAVLPFGDPYWDIGVVKTFLKSGSAEVINNMTKWPSSTLAWMSGWPLLHIFSVIFISVTGLSVMHSALLVTFFFICMFFLFVYILISLVSKRISDRATLSPIAILIFATSPESLYWNIQFKYQTIAMLLMLIVYFIIFKTFSRNAKSVGLTIVMMITLFAMVIGHNLTSMAIAAYLIFIVIISKILDYFISDLYFKNKVYTNLAIVTLLLGFLWSLQYVNFIWSSIGLVVNRLIAFFSGINSLEKVVVMASYPDILRPAWGRTLLIIRDLIMYIPALLGYLLVIKQLPKKNIFNYLVVMSLSVFGIMLIADMLIIHIEPLRIVTYALPFVALVSALFYSHILRQRIVLFVFVVTVISVGYIGQWSHNFIPLHLWNNIAINNDIGEHNLQYNAIDGFINKNVGDYELIYGDDFSLLYSLLEPDSYYKIRAFRRSNVVENNTRSIVVSFRNFGVYNYSAAMAISTYEKVNEYGQYLNLSNEIRENVNERMSGIFDCGSIKVFVTKGA